MHHQKLLIMDKHIIWIVVSSVFFDIIAALTGKKSKIGPYWSFLIGDVLLCIGWLVVAWVRETYPKPVDNEQ